MSNVPVFCLFSVFYFFSRVLTKNAHVCLNFCVLISQNKKGVVSETDPTQELVGWARDAGIWTGVEGSMGVRGGRRLTSAGRGIDRMFAAVYGTNR